MEYGLLSCKKDRLVRLTMSQEKYFRDNYTCFNLALIRIEGADRCIRAEVEAEAEDRM